MGGGGGRRIAHSRRRLNLSGGAACRVGSIGGIDGALAAHRGRRSVHRLPAHWLSSAQTARFALQGNGDKIGLPRRVDDRDVAAVVGRPAGGGGVGSAVGGGRVGGGDRGRQARLAQRVYCVTNGCFVVVHLLLLYSPAKKGKKCNYLRLEKDLMLLKIKPFRYRFKEAPLSLKRVLLILFKRRLH